MAVLNRLQHPNSPATTTAAMAPETASVIAAEKLRALREADRCTKPGELSAR